MCGLMATNLTFSLNNLIKSLDTLNKRGPDERNYILYNDIFLGHTRLSITGDNGTQPFYIPNKLICLVNGEFYDYKNIKKNLMGYTLFYATCFFYISKGFNLSKFTGVSLFLLNEYIQFMLVRQRFKSNKYKVFTLVLMKNYLKYHSSLDLFLYI